MTTARSDTVWQSPDLARKYLTGIRGAIPLANEQVAVMLRLLGAIGRPIEHFVDLGCGDGVLADAILAEHPEAYGLVADFNAEMIGAARQRLDRFRPRVCFEQLDYSKPRWVDAVAVTGPMDAIVSGFSIHHQPDHVKRRIYREVFGLLRPGGIFVNIEHVASPTPWAEARGQDHLVDAMWSFHRQDNLSVTREEVGQKYVYNDGDTANILSPVDAQLRWLRRIGYVDVDCYFKVFELAILAGRKPA